MSPEPGRAVRVALVTGAAGAVGTAVADRLKDAGWAVAGVDTRACDCALALTADIADRRDMVEVAERVRRELGPIDLLVTAADRHDSARMGELPHERWLGMLDVNLGGTVNACAAVVPDMVAAGHGTVVTTTSWLSLAGAADDAYYAASKGAVIAFTKSFSLEVARDGVRVNCVAIGPSDKDAQAAGAGMELVTAGAARAAAPEAVASTVLFLAEEGDFYVGQVFAPTAGVVL
jgi:2-hydroxycyclohexanecarboxyl-CoA dehydrogenase